MRGHAISRVLAKYDAELAHNLTADAKMRYAEPLILLRFLDDAVRRQSGSPWQVVSVPLTSLGAQAPGAERALIVENKVNLLTLPAIDGAIALGGLGNGVTDLRYVSWLVGLEIWYWGDLDAEGFAILSRLRALFPHARSLMMDERTMAAAAAMLSGLPSLSGD